MGRQGVYMSGMVDIRLLTSRHVLGRILGLYQLGTKVLEHILVNKSEANNETVKGVSVSS